MTPPNQSGPARLDSPSLLALGTAAVVAVYAAGWIRTRDDSVGAVSGRHGRRTDGDVARRAAVGRGAPAAPAAPDSAMVGTTSASPVANVPAPPTDTGAIGTSPPEVQEQPVGPEVRDSVPPPPPSVPASPPAPPAPSVGATGTPTDTAATRAAAGWRDGTYAGWGSSRHGDIEATVVIEQGRIVAASISRCLTRYSCSWIAHLQPQVATRQSPDVDNVSGATESADAFYYAVVDALKKAK